MREYNTDGVLVGRPYQTIHEQSQTQKYPIGTIYEAFGRRYRYCQAYEDITIARRGCPTHLPATWTQTPTYNFGSNGSTASGTKGNNFLLISLGADDDGTVTPKDRYVDGLVTLFPPSPRDDEIFEYRIIGNDLGYTVSITGDRVKLYVDPPLSEDWTAIPCDGLISPYAKIRSPGSGTGNHAFVVVAPIQVTSAYYFWGQTRGPAWVTPSAGWTTANYRDVCFHTNGTIIADIDSTGVAKQRAGYILPVNGTDDDSHIMLMLE